MTTAEVRRLDPSELLGLAADLRAVYARAFERPPWHEPDHKADDYLARLRSDVARPGFTAVAALDTCGRPVGFATAWTTPRLFPSDRCHPYARKALGDGATRELLCGAREIDELAVHPDHQRKGIGAALLEAVSADAPGGRCWLFTAAAAGGPMDFYLRLGWQPVTRPAPHPAGVLVLLGPRHPGADVATRRVALVGATQ
ncbi:GNAT family N-acetyltransferase [Kitasatospora sp. NPDC092039]|uniref:GNAT family N-acetyltransferase n=1 Tax=Kitasatospora sp. NPDC092039 TaxID=3364086 RepID=UPI00381B93A0